MSQSAKQIFITRILRQPEDTTCSLGDCVNIEVLVESPNASFQWYNKEGQKIPNQNFYNLLFWHVRSQDFGVYKLEILDLVTQVRACTRWVKLEKEDVIGTETKPIPLTSSSDGCYRKGSTFTLTAHFRNATAYQWYKDWKKLKGCTGKNLTIFNANMSNHGKYALAALNGTNKRVINVTWPIKVDIF